MPRPGQVDHVEKGLLDLPEKLRKPRVSAYYSVYLRAFNEIEELVHQLMEAFANWQTAGQQYEFVLNIIGELLAQPRPVGFDNAAYTFLLQARVLVRQSQARRDDVWRVAEFLAHGNSGTVDCFFLAPKIVVVAFYDVSLTAQEQALYRTLLTDTIDAVDKLTVIYTTSSHAGYDVGLYDTELYAP